MKKLMELSTEKRIHIPCEVTAVHKFITLCGEHSNNDEVSQAGYDQIEGLVNSSEVLTALVAKHGYSYQSL